MKKTVSLKENHLFRRLYNKGRSAVCPELALYVRKNGRSGNRLGLTVSTKVGCAVVRRRLREIYRLNEDMLTSGVDIVVVARVRAAHVPYRRLEQAFLKLCAKVDMLAK